MHVPSSPAILYFGTPVVLIASVNEDGTHNLAPMSSAFWLGWRCVIGLAAGSKTTQNLLRTGECVLNLPSVNEVVAVNRLALTTGSHPVPATKRARGYRHVQDKFGEARLTADPADTVHAPRVRECPVQMEAVVEATHGVAERDERLRGHIRTFELRIQRVHVDDALALIEVDPLLLTETYPPSCAPKVAQSVDGCRRSNAAPTAIHKRISLCAASRVRFAGLRPPLTLRRGGRGVGARQRWVNFS